MRSHDGDLKAYSRHATKDAAAQAITVPCAFIRVWPQHGSAGNKAEKHERRAADQLLRNDNQPTKLKSSTLSARTG